MNWDSIMLGASKEAEGWGNIVNMPPVSAKMLSTQKVWLSSGKRKKKELKKNTLVLNKKQCLSNNQEKKKFAPLTCPALKPTNSQETLLNRLTATLPLDCRVNIAGFWHSLILVGALYRYSKLNWVLLNRNNHQIYLSSHIAPDCLHVVSSINDSTWCRQSFNKICCVYKSQTEYDFHQGTRLLQILPTEILHHVQDEPVSAVDAFCSTYARNDKDNEDWSLPHLPATKSMFLRRRALGSKIINGRCVDGKQKFKCPCDQTVAKVRADAVAVKWDISQVAMYYCPTSLPNIDILTPFINYVKANPTVMFFPTSKE